MREITVFATEGIFTFGISDIGSLVVVGRKEEKKTTFRHTGCRQV